MGKISVIIPVYNSERYLNKCINSLLNQTYTNCEFIFVNDGSVDNSVQIINDIKKSDERIKLIIQNNYGVSSARNKGIDVANGEYLSFVDADDFLNENYLEVMVNHALRSNCDIIISNINIEFKGEYTVNNSKYKKDSIYNKNKINSILIPEFIKGSSLNSVCNKIYRTSIIKDAVNFPNGIVLGEDGIFNLKSFDNANTILFIDYAGYNYREVHGSATKNIFKKDYFANAIDIYNYDYQKEINFKLDKNDFLKWKAIKFIESIVSFIAIYLENGNGLSLKEKIGYVNNMICNVKVQQLLSKYKNELLYNKSKYEIFIVNCMAKKAVFKIVLANFYSQIRNK